MVTVAAASRSPVRGTQNLEDAMLHSHLPHKQTDRLQSTMYMIEILVFLAWKSDGTLSKDSYVELPDSKLACVTSDGRLDSHRS